MRGDGLGVGDVGAVPGGGTWNRRDATGGDDGRGSRWEFDAGVVGGRSRYERGTRQEPREYGVIIDDGARGEYGDDYLQCKRTGGADGMRGDGVGILHIGAM